VALTHPQLATSVVAANAGPPVTRPDPRDPVAVVLAGIGRAPPPAAALTRPVTGTETITTEPVLGLVAIFPVPRLVVSWLVVSRLVTPVGAEPGTPEPVPTKALAQQLLGPRLTFVSG
jgi:hypothetical protein